MHVLVVDDDVFVQQLLRKRLTTAGHVVDAVSTGDAGLEIAASDVCDAVILDLSLPDMDGLDVARALRRSGNHVPILMLSGRVELEHRLEGLTAGADDYLIKPFAFRELLLRLQAITRRSASTIRNDRLVVGDLVLTRSAHEVARAGVPIKLAPKEFAVLEFLMEHPGQVLSRTAILERVWEYSYDGLSNVVDSVIRRLRKAIDGPGSKPLIHTVHAMGYKINVGSA